jgi:hypothetical protein
VRAGIASLLGGMAFASANLLLAQSGALTVPKTVEAGSAFSIQSSGSGKAVLYILGPEQVLKRDVQLGETTTFQAGSLCNAGHYLAVLTAGSTDSSSPDSRSSESSSFDVLPAKQPGDISFLAGPSRLPVGIPDGITGAVYVFDTYQNLIVAPTQVSFELSNSSGAVQKRSVMTSNGSAWTTMDSSPNQGKATFVARAGDIASTRVIGQVPGDPCSLKMNAKQSGRQLELETDPVRDCRGNAVPDGTIVTFTETYGGEESTVDVPLKRGIAKVEMPAYPGATITVASGVALGNQIRLEK